jgi:hypothetical protein
VLKEVVAPEVVLQHIPRAVTVTPPSDWIFPPDTPVVVPMNETAVVESVGTEV